MKRLLAAGALLCCVLFAGAADGALVKVGNLVLTADGGFTPRTLPRSSFAPIEFEGRADLRAVDGSVPPPLRQLVLDFDRDGRLTTAGIPVCQPSQLDAVTPQEARRRCPGAIVGTGRADAMIALGGQPPFLASSPITLFNGPRLAGKPTVILHARTTVPAVQNFVITIPIEKRPGAFRYRATLDLPPIAGGAGSLVHLDAAVGKRYRLGGKERSYVTARCGDGVLRTHGRFTFGDGTIIDGSVDKGCTAVP
ncbi:MAG TPA: hypothetical protein VFS48_00950 [Solirubrobacterales bacterium]|nr:hypothetical protein [Solirubrobacterales bacterium]